MVLVLLLILSATACGSAAEKKDEYVSIGTSGTGGTYASVGTAMVKVINDNTDVIATVEGTPGGGDGNIRLLGQKQIEFGLSTTSSGYSAYNKQSPFDKEDCSNVRTVMVGLDTQFHIIVPADSNLNSINDLKGKKIGTASAGNAQVYVPQLLEAFGMTKNDLEIIQLETGETAEALKDGNIDAIVTAAIAPASAYQDLGVSRPVRYLSVPEENANKLAQKYPFYVPGIIKANTYTGQDKDVYVPTIKVVLYARADVPEDTVYKVTKALLENNEALAKLHPAAQVFSPDNQKAFMQGTIIPPLHSGAEKYYKEVGIIK